VSAAPPTVVPILATPFGVVPVPDAGKLNAALAPLFAARAAAGDSPEQNPLCYRSRDDLLDWPEQPVQQLAGELLRGVYAVVAGVNAFTEAQLRSLVPQARAWFTIVRADGCVPATSYPLTAWCGVYCVEAPEPSASRRDSGVLRLYESRLGTMFADASTSMMRVPFTPGHYAWRPVPGQLAVFPASVTHEIALIRSLGQLTLVTLRVRFVGPGQTGVSTW
jgi:hypothetical protein